MFSFLSFALLALSFNCYFGGWVTAPPLHPFLSLYQVPCKGNDTPSPPLPKTSSVHPTRSGPAQHRKLAKKDTPVPLQGKGFIRKDPQRRRRHFILLRDRARAARLPPRRAERGPLRASGQRHVLCDAAQAVCMGAAGGVGA